MLWFINLRRLAIGCGIAAVLAVVLSAAALTWVYLTLRPGELVIDNGLLAGIYVGPDVEGNDLCDTITIQARAKRTYRGTWLCKHPGRIRFSTPWFEDTCLWADAKHVEPVVVTASGTNCSTNGSVPRSDVSPPFQPIATPTGR